MNLFGIDTLISTIGLFLSGGTSYAIEWTSAILTAASIAISNDGKIREAARIYRSSEHKFKTELIGFVVDNTRYSNVAVVAQYGSDTVGRIAGGYSPDDYTSANWNWVTTKYSPYSGRAASFYSNYAVNAMLNYDRDLTSNYGTTSFSPSIP